MNYKIIFMLSLLCSSLLQIRNKTLNHSHFHLRCIFLRVQSSGDKSRGQVAGTFPLLRTHQATSRGNISPVEDTPGDKSRGHTFVSVTYRMNSNHLESMRHVAGTKFSPLVIRLSCMENSPNLWQL